MTPLLLALLAIVDTAFAGFRAAAGRNARIFKFAYYRQSVLRGALAGIGLVAVLAMLTGLALVLVPDPTRQYAELVSVGERMLWLLGAYAALVIAALVVYAVADWDLRSLATVAILGPFTLLRAWVIALASAVGLFAGVGPTTWALTLVSCSAVVLLGRALERSYARRLDVLQNRHSPPTPAIGPPKVGDSVQNSFSGQLPFLKTAAPPAVTVRNLEPARPLPASNTRKPSSP